MTREQRSFEKILKGWLFYLPLLLGAVLMLPRILSPQFGLFDDGKTLITAKEMAKNLSYFTFEAAEGRFRPVYWLYFSAMDWIFGQQPFWFFLGNTVVLVLSTWMLMVFIQLVTGRRFQAWLGGLLFVLSGPVIESFYTLSKGEPLQVALLLLAMLSSVWLVKDRVIWKKGLFGLFGLLTTFCAMAVKETSIVMIPVSLTWLILNWLRRKKTLEQGGKQAWGMLASGVLVIFSMIGSGMFLVLRRFMIHALLTEGSYTNDYAFQVQTILTSLVRWAGWLIRDFTFIVPLVILAVLWLVSQKKPIDTGFILEAVIWMGGWAAIYLPWFFMTEYYMLPFAVGVAVFTGALIEIGQDAIVHSQDRMRWLAIVCLVLSGLLFSVTLFNNASNAGIQLSVDAANDRMLKNLVKIAPTDSRVMINIQYPNEYCSQIPIYINSILGRPDIQVEIFSSQPPLGKENGGSGHNLVITPVVKNQPILTVRMGVVEPTQEIWLSILDNYLILADWQMISSSDYHFPLIIFDLSRVFCPLLRGQNFCERSAPLIDTREFSYGWKIYSLDSP